MKLNVYFDESCGICKKISKIISYLDFKNKIECRFAEELEDNSDETIRNNRYYDLFSFDGKKYFTGYDTYLEIVKRIPLIFQLYFFMKFKIIRIIGEKYYRRIADKRKCKINLK